MTLIEKETAIYIAGLIDGDGCITAAATNANCPHVSIGIAHQQTIRWIQRELGFGTVTKNDRNKRINPKYKTLWCWQTNNTRDISELLTATLPYLKVKRNVAGLVLDLCQSKLKGRHLRGYDGLVRKFVEDEVVVRIKEAIHA